MRMRASKVLAFAGSFALAGAALAQEGGSGEAARVAAPVPIPAADLSWTDLDPAGAPGVQVAPLWGDHREGGFGAFFKLPAGFSAALHRHTHDMRLVIVSGIYVQRPEGKPEFELGPGSYLLQPGGDYRHTTSCAPGSDCVFFVESGGAFDLRVVATPEAPAAE